MNFWKAEIPMKNSEKNLFTGFFRFLISLFQSGETGKKVIIDRSKMRKRESGSKVHFLYVLLFICGILASLWQHGDPRFTLGILCAVIPFAFFLFVPYRFADTMTRQLISAGIFFGACFYAVYRINKHIPFDLVLVESLILCSFTFLINCTKKDYRYLFFNSLFLLIYGGLVPRKLMLYIIPAACFLLLVILLWEREESIAGEGEIVFQKYQSPVRGIFRTWHIRFFHILLALPVFLYIFSLIPLYETGSEGFFEVSFMTERTSMLPPDLQKWLNRNKKFAKSPDGETTIKSDTPDTHGKEGPRTDTPTQKGAVDGNGKGGGTPGKDLLFTAVLPVKLYHLGALYDVYDGTKWSSSKEMKEAKIRENSLKNYVRIFPVKGKYVLHKWNSRTLPTPFRVTDIDLYNMAGGNYSIRERLRLFRLDHTSYSAMIPEKTDLPKLPFQYTSTSNPAIPLSIEERNEKKEQKKDGGPKSPSLTVKAYASVREIFTEDFLEEQERKARKKTSAPVKKKEQPRMKKKQAVSAVPARRKTAIVLRHEPSIGSKAAVTEMDHPLRFSARILEKDPYRIQRAKISAMEDMPPVKKGYFSRRHDHSWQELVPKTHYLQLPHTLSTRVSGLAGIITKDAETPYQKAVALRDHLRKNYKYKLHAVKTPEGKESTEYFLFELKEGHCEYFAAALTVLARSVGLPARVATGFSPGNFNALTKQFEVYEYHAHAWSQIYIANVGWLTFDAVPPGEVISETSPAGLGLLRDPFGEEWKITPPELTSTTLGYIRSTLLKEALQQRSEELNNTVRKMLENDKNLKNEGKKQKAKAKVKAKNTKNTVQNRQTNVRERLKNFFRYYLGRNAEKLFAVFNSRKAPYTGMAFLIFAGSCFFLCKNLFHLFRLLMIRRKFNFLIRSAAKEKENAPEKSILCLYRALRLLLFLAGMERKNNQELLAYAGETGKMFTEAWKKKWTSPDEKEWEKIMEKGKEFSGDIYSIFSAFYSLEYGNSPVTARDAVFLYAKAENIYTLLRELYSEGFFFPEKFFFTDPFSR